MKSDLDKKHK